jgi:hypothetical protein
MGLLQRKKPNQAAFNGGGMAFLAGILMLTGCIGDGDWPPAPRNKQEQLVLEAALRAIHQYDGWSDVACVVEKAGSDWRVQGWKVVHPKAQGRKKCVPWAVRSITVDSRGLVTAYRNTLQE